MFTNLDKLIVEFDKALRTLAATPVSARPVPGNALAEAQLSDAEKRHAAALMRVNHCGEVCAQALRTLAATPVSARPVPGNALAEAQLSDAEKRHAAALMRVNHCGEVCAQA